MTAGEKVVLTRHDRKDRLGHGGVKAVAEELGVDASLVSRVVNGKQRHQPTEDAIARRIVRAPHEEAFPPREDEKSGAGTTTSGPAESGEAGMVVGGRGSDA